MAYAKLVGAAVVVALGIAGCGGDGGDYDETPSESPSPSVDSAPRRIGGGDVPVTFEIPGDWHSFDSTSGDLERQLADANLSKELRSRVEMAVAQMDDIPLLYALDPKADNEFGTNINAYCGTNDEDTSLGAIEKTASSTFKSMKADDVESERVTIEGGKAVATSYVFKQENSEISGRQYGIPVSEQVCYVTFTTSDPENHADTMTMLNDSLSIK